MNPARCAAFLALIVTVGCASLEGEFHSRGGVAGNWDMVPNRCRSGGHLGFRGVDMYTDEVRDDTEVIVAPNLLDGGAVLVRIPGAQRVLKLTPADCNVFQVDAHLIGVKTNGSPAHAGSVTIDCESAEIGHVYGHATFTCL